MRYILYGMKNSGKTTFGNMLSQQFNIDFIDIDVAIEQEYNKANANPKRFFEIYNNYGEKTFRQLEQNVVEGVAIEGEKIVATGGSTMLFPLNIKKLRQCGKLVYLNVDRKILLDRFLLRPLTSVIDQDLNLAFSSMYSYRHKRYTTIADTIIELGGGDANTNYNYLLKQLEIYG
jgi:shikimate kinase